MSAISPTVAPRAVSVDDEERRALATTLVGTAIDWYD